MDTYIVNKLEEYKSLPEDNPTKKAIEAYKAQEPSSLQEREEIKRAYHWLIGFYRYLCSDDNAVKFNRLAREDQDLIQMYMFNDLYEGFLKRHGSLIEADKEDLKWKLGRALSLHYLS